MPQQQLADLDLMKQAFRLWLSMHHLCACFVSMFAEPVTKLPTMMHYAHVTRAHVCTQV